MLANRLPSRLKAHGCPRNLLSICLLDRSHTSDPDFPKRATRLPLSLKTQLPISSREKTLSPVSTDLTIPPSTTKRPSSLILETALTGKEEISFPPVTSHTFTGPLAVAVTRRCPS